MKSAKGKPKPSRPNRHPARQAVDKTGSQESGNRKGMGSGAVSRFTIPIQTRDLIEHAIELWRMEQRLNRIAASLNESQRSLVTSSIQRLKRYLEKNEIEIVDHTNQKFNHGRNLDVLLVEKSPDVTEPIVRDTKEPTILCKNHIVHRGKVIVLEGERGTKHE